MKTILSRLFNHEELTSEETRQILLNLPFRDYEESYQAIALKYDLRVICG